MKCRTRALPVSPVSGTRRRRAATPLIPRQTTVIDRKRDEPPRGGISSGAGDNYWEASDEWECLAAGRAQRFISVIKGEDTGSARRQLAGRAPGERDAGPDLAAGGHRSPGKESRLSGVVRMLTARAVFGEIFGNDEAFRLFCSIAASGEAQGGWENGRIAALVPESYRDLAPKIARHGADEDKHGRIFNALLRKRGLEPVPVPVGTDYTMLLENAGLGLPHSQLRRGQKLTEDDIITYLAHSRVTEQRASEQMRALRKYAGSRPDIGRAIMMISDDEDNHLAYCHEELLRLASAGHADTIHRTLRATALAEIAIYRDVSKAVMAHLGRILGWPRPKSATLAAGIQAIYLYERLGGWRRMVSLRMPARRNALGGPRPARAGYT